MDFLQAFGAKKNAVNCALHGYAGRRYDSACVAAVGYGIAMHGVFMECFSDDTSIETWMREDTAYGNVIC